MLRNRTDTCGPASRGKLPNQCCNCHTYAHHTLKFSRQRFDRQESCNYPMKDQRREPKYQQKSLSHLHCNRGTDNASIAISHAPVRVQDSGHTSNQAMFKSSSDWLGMARQERRLQRRDLLEAMNLPTNVFEIMAVLGGGPEAGGLNEIGTRNKIPAKAIYRGSVPGSMLKWVSLDLAQTSIPLGLDEFGRRRRRRRS